MAERFFILTPTQTDKLAPSSSGDMYPVYLDASGLEMKWSGKAEPPRIGASVEVAINQLGPATVVGYAESQEWLGLMVKLDNPPEWWKKQRVRMKEETARARQLGPERAQIERLRVWPKWVLDGISVVFGAEIK